MQNFKFLLFLLLAGMAMRSSAQTTRYYQQAYSRQYPLAVNEKVTSILIFPAAIVPGGIDRGSSGIIAQQVDGVPNILKIKAASKDFTTTNLTIITNDGKVYSYRVDYSHYADSKPIDMGKEQQRETAAAIFKNRKLNDAQVAQLAKHIATRKPFMHHPKEKSFGITVRLRGIYISQDVLFYRIELCNKTAIDYTTDFMRFYIRDKKRVKRTAQQEQELKPLYIYREHGHVTAGKTRQSIVIAFPKFTVAEHKNFELQIFEQNGDRNLNLKTNGSDIARAAYVPFSPNL